MKIKYIVQLMLFIFLFGACQKEDETTVIQNPNNIFPGSSLAKLISRVSQNPTELDNIIDNTSCFSVQLPVSVVVNGQIITITTQSDYQLVQNAIDFYTTDDDVVHFEYPITIQFQNFTTQVVNDSNQLDDIIDDCNDDDGFDEIDCIAINYPIAINIYDSNNQVANTITIQSNPQLFNFIGSLSTSIIAAIVYPISVTNSNGEDVLINSNTTLETFINSSIDDCDDSGINPNPTFTSAITSGSWYVSYFFIDEDHTSEYNEYTFTFMSNGAISVLKNTTTSSGWWSTYTDSGEYKIDLSFDNSDLDELQDDWTIIDYTTTTIHLKHVSGSGSDIRYLYFTKN